MERTIRTRMIGSDRECQLKKISVTSGIFCKKPKYSGADQPPFEEHTYRLCAWRKRSSGEYANARDSIMRGRYAEAKPIMARGPIVLDTPFCTWVSSSKNLFLSLSPCPSTRSHKRKTANETKERTKGEGHIDNAIGGGLHRWPLFESAICIYLGPLFEPWEIHGAGGGARTAKEKERRENLFGERGKGWERSTSRYGTTLRFGWKKARGARCFGPHYQWI